MLVINPSSRQPGRSYHLLSLLTVIFLLSCSAQEADEVVDTAQTVLTQSVENTQQQMGQRLLSASQYTISADSELTAFMIATAEQAITDHCAACHGPDLEGQPGVPNLVDYDWLWGVTGLEMNNVAPVMEIQQTILYGVRNLDCPDEIKQYGACPDTRFSQMPAYGTSGFTDEQVSDLTEYVINMSGAEADPEAVARVEELWPICAECHGDDGYGYKPFGGPDLMDDIWLFGDSREQVYDVIYNGRTESCPAWSETLGPATIKALAVYIFNKANGF